MYYDGSEGAFRTMSNAPMLHFWSIGTIKVVIGRLFRLSLKLEPGALQVTSPNATVRACPRTRPRSTAKTNVIC